MVRALLAVIACLCLTGCWQSETRFFGPDDWARLGLSGEYNVAGISDSDNPPRHATLTSRPDGLVEFVPHGAGEDKPTLLGLVAITGGSGRYFIAMDRTNDGNGDTYYLAELSSSGGLAFYYPDCDGTPPIDGLVVETSTFSASKTCTFTTEEAVMTAALEAERFLSTPHIVGVAPFLAFSKAGQDSDD